MNMQIKQLKLIKYNSAVRLRAHGDFGIPGFPYLPIQSIVPPIRSLAVTKMHEINRTVEVVR